MTRPKAHFISLVKPSIAAVWTAMFVLVLAPEAYVPLRALGANYHASAEGMRAADQVFDVLETPLPARGVRTEIPDPSTCGITIDALRVEFPGRPRPALDDVSFEVAPRQIVAVTGPSGAGKSSLLHIAGLLEAPTSGEIFIEGAHVVVGDARQLRG